MRNVHLLLVSMTLGCDAGSLDVPLQQGQGPLAKNLRVSLSASSDPLGAGVGWSVTITNVGAAQVDDLTLIFDEQWAAPIRELRGCRPAGTKWDGAPGCLPAGASLVVFSNHDVTNHHLLRDAADTPYPADHVPRTVGLKSADSRGVWRAR